MELSLHACIGAWKRNYLSNVECRVCPWRPLHSQPQQVALSTVPSANSPSQGDRKKGTVAMTFGVVQASNRMDAR